MQWCGRSTRGIGSRTEMARPIAYHSEEISTGANAMTQPAAPVVLSVYTDYV